MADETLFEGERGGRRRGEAPDIDQVFSRAVEDQLEQQRELNRLVQETTDRLSGLEEGLRAFRDQTTSSLTALRGELHEDVARLAETVGERTRQLAEELDRLRSTSTDHQVRLVQLAEAAGAAIDALDDKHARLAEELADVGEQLRADDPSQSDLVVAALDRFEVSFGARIDERISAVSHRLGRLHEQISAEDEVDLGHELGRLHHRIDGLEEELRTSVLEAAQRGSEERHDAHARLAGRLREEVGQDVVAALRPVLEDQGASVSRLEEALARRSAELIAQAEQDRDTAASGRAEIQEGLRDQRSSLEDVQRRLSGLDALHRRLDVLEQVHRHLEALGGIPEQLEALAGVPERLDGLADVTAGVAPDVAGQLRRSLTPIAEDLVELRDQLAVLRASSAGDEEALEELRRQLTEVIGSRLEDVRTAAIEQRDALDAALQATRDAVEAHRDRVAEDLREDRAQLEAGVGAVLEAVETRLDDVDRAMRTELPEALERQRAGVADTLQRQDAALSGSLERQQEVLSEALERQHEELARQLQRQREELAATISEPLADATERLRAAQEELRGAASELAGLPGEVDEQVVAGVDRAARTAREEAEHVTTRVESAVERLGETQQRLDELETSLVAYLEARDARLEEERMQVLRDLVEEFAEGLSRRDRRRLARRLDDVRERVGVTPSSRDGADREVGEDAPGGAEEEPRPSATSPSGTESDEPRGLLAALLGEPEIDEALSQPPPSEDEAASDDVASAEGPGPDDAVAPQGGAGAAEAEEEPAEVDGHPCPECGFVAKSPGGLGSHRRVHA